MITKKSTLMKNQTNKQSLVDNKEETHCDNHEWSTWQTELKRKIGVLRCARHHLWAETK